MTVNKILSFLMIMILTACNNDSYSTRSKYYPGQYRPELNIGNNSTITKQTAQLVSDTTQILLITTKDIKDNSISVGNAEIELKQIGGSGTVVLSTTTDNGDGTYLVSVKGIKKGSVTLQLIANSKQLPVVTDFEVITGQLNTTESILFISQTNFLLNNIAQIIFIPRDSNRNEIISNEFVLHPTVTGGLSQGIVSSFVYDNGNYLADFTANQVGSESELNVSVRGFGIVTSPYKISIQNTKPDYSNSTITINKSLIQVGEETQISINLKDLQNNLLNLDLIPIVLEYYNGTGTVLFSEVIKSGSFYIATIKGVYSGTELKIRAKIDGTYIKTINEKTIQVVP